MAEHDLEALRVRLQSGAQDGRPGEPRLGRHLAALAGAGSAAATRDSSATEDDLPGAMRPGTPPDAVSEQPGFDHRPQPPHPTARRPVAADGLPPVAPGPSVRSLMAPRNPWDEGRAADVVPMPKRSAEDRRRQDGPRMLGVGALPETAELEDVEGHDGDDRAAGGTTAPCVHRPEGREDCDPRAMRSLRPSEARKGGLPLPRRSAAILLAATIVGILGIAGAALVRAADGPDHAVPLPTPTAVAAADVTMTTWRGMDLPVSAVAGPFVVGESHVSGFARTELGAAVAAAHLSVRLDPAAGPPTFEGVLEDQVVGDVDRMAAAVRSQYRAEATREQQAGRQPLPVTPGRLLGWRTDGDLGVGSVTVHLAVQPPAGARSDFAVPLRWSAGDWAVEAAESGPFFPVAALSGEYRAFETGETR